jgi:hypothetical protein
MSQIFFWSPRPYSHAAAFNSSVKPALHVGLDRWDGDLSGLAVLEAFKRAAIHQLVAARHPNAQQHAGLRRRYNGRPYVLEAYVERIGLHRSNSFAVLCLQAYEGVTIAQMKTCIS